MSANRVTDIVGTDYIDGVEDVCICAICGELLRGKKAKRIDFEPVSTGDKSLPAFTCRGTCFDKYMEFLGTVRECDKETGGNDARFDRCLRRKTEEARVHEPEFPSP
jgi:hypothetical protein